MAPDSRFGKQLPVDFERNWQGLGGHELTSINPDAIQVFPQYKNLPVAIAVSIWCEHAVGAFHQACESYRLPYFLA